MALSKKTTSLTSASSARPNVLKMIKEIRADNGGRPKKYIVINTERGGASYHYGNNREQAINVIAEPKKDILKRKRKELEHKIKLFTWSANSVIGNIIDRFKR